MKETPTINTKEDVMLLITNMMGQANTLTIPKALLSFCDNDLDLPPKKWSRYNVSKIGPVKRGDTWLKKVTLRNKSLVN